jgi:hypothetical protein
MTHESFIRLLTPSSDDGRMLMASVRCDVSKQVQAI